jgi:hypothetical protein
LCEPPIVRAGLARIKPKLKAPDREIMRPLRVERMEKCLAEAVKRIHGAILIGQSALSLVSPCGERAFRRDLVRA